jgi:hypothetical protein
LVRAVTDASIVDAQLDEQLTASVHRAESVSLAAERLVAGCGSLFKAQLLAAKMQQVSIDLL